MRRGPITGRWSRPTSLAILATLSMSPTGCDRRDAQAYRPPAPARNVVLGSMGGGSSTSAR